MATERPVELIRALAVLAEEPAAEHVEVAAALGLPEPPDGTVWADLFLFQLHPYASVQVGPEGMLGGEARERVAGFWKAVGRTAPKEPDHLVALLGLYAGLLDEAAEYGGARSARVQEAARALLHEHLAPWVFAWLARAVALGGAFHRCWAELLREVLAEEAAAPGGPTGRAVHLAEAPPLPDPRTEGGEAFLAGLLAPVRCGMILARADLARLAADLGLGLRAGERRYVLEHLLAQEPVAVLEGLADRAGKAAEEHRDDLWAPPAVAAFWAARAVAAAELLDDLAAEGAEAVRTAGEVPASGDRGAPVPSGGVGGGDDG